MAVNVGELEAVLSVKDKMTPGIKKAQGGLKGMMATFAKFAGAAVAVGAAVKFITAALDAQSTQIDAINKMNIALANQGNLLDGTSESLQAYASELQKTTKFGDEQILMLQSTLAGFGMNEEQIKKTTIATLDMAEAKGIDATAAAELMGKAFVGETSMLSRYGIILDKGIPKNQKFAAALAQVNLKFGGQAQAGVATFSGRMKQLGNAFGDTMEAVGKLFGSLSGGEDVFPTLIGWVESLTEFIGGDLILAISEMRAIWIEMVAKLTDGAAKALEILGKLPDALGGAKFRKAAEAVRENAAGQRKWAESIRETGNQAATSVGKTLDLTNGTKTNTEAVVHNAVALEGLFAAYDMINTEAMPDAIGGAIKHAKAMAFQAGEIMKATPQADGFNATLQEMVDYTEDATDVLVDLDQAAGDIARTFATAGSSTGGFASSMASLPGVILGALQGGGNVGKSIGASLGADLGKEMGKKVTVLLGDSLGKMGASLGGLMGPLGTMLGSIAGEFAGKAFGAVMGMFISEEEEVNDLRDAFFEAQGGFEAFSVSMASASDEDWAKKIFDAETVEEFNALILESQGLLDMKGVADQKLQDAVEKYGFSIEELGPKWAAQELETMAGGLLEEYNLLVASGIEQGTVLDKMGESMSEYVNSAVAAGQSVPEAMRPMIEAAIKNGEILDENGEAYTSAEDAGITFAQTMTESMMSVVDSIKELVAALTGIDPDPIVIPVTYDYRNRPPSGGGGNRNRNDDEYPEFAEGGIVTKPTFGLIGEAGPEAIIPLNQLSTGGGSDVDIDALVRKQTRELSKAFRDAILQAPVGG